MHGDTDQAFSYWKAMMEKCFGYITKIGLKEEKSEEEEALTQALLKLVNNMNTIKITKPGKAEAITLTESEIKEINREK